MLNILAKSVFAFFAVLAYTQLSHAQDYQIGNAVIAGTGCPAGTAAVAVSPDKKTLSILFDKFSVEAPAGSRGGVVRCHLRIQVRNITPGYILDTTTFDFRGFAQLPQGTVASIGSRGGAEGAGRMRMTQEQISNSGDFTISRTAQQNDVGRCNSRPNDMIKLDIALALSPRDVMREDGLITIDTADLGNDGGMKVGVALKECDKKSGKIKDLFRAIREARQQERLEQKEERQQMKHGGLIAAILARAAARENQ